MAQTPLKVAFVGAGAVNFGGPEGPWDHATRLERYHSETNTPLVVYGIVEPNPKRADFVLSTRRSNPKYAHLYANTKVFADLQEMWKENDRPDCVFIGLPPACHGTTIAPNDAEVQCAREGVHMFVEKPLSCHPANETKAVCEQLKNSKSKDGRKLIVSVGYMLRYSAGVRKMKELIAKNGWKVANTVARYNCAYASVPTTVWWDDRKSGGPIVEQATHFVDLSRYFVGEVNMNTVQAIAIPPTSPMGELQCVQIDESVIPEMNRIPRATAAFWQYENGAIGSLNHALLLQGTKYTAEFEVWGDGFRLLLVDPYHDCKLFVRTNQNENEIKINIENDDMYYTELEAFLNGVSGGDGADGDGILATYEDSVKTYEMTWAIRTSSEKSWKH